MVRKYQKTSPRTIRATVPQLGLDQTGCRSPFFWANIFEKRWIYNMQDKNILCSIRVSFETKVLVFARQFWTLVPLCTFISNPHCTIHSYVADRRVSEFWKTGYIQIIVGIPFFVGMQKEAVTTILNIVKFTTTPHNI
jgi:hypothetical protein